jgi:1-deoxy-D-xylulose-5-phosphate synthase
MAARGLRPVMAVYSTFMQRAADQVIHDVCIQKLPVTFALDRAGFVSDDGETHQGLFDIALFRSVPNMTILAPAGDFELKAMLDWAQRSGGPCIIRYPKAVCPPNEESFHAPLEWGRGTLIRREDRKENASCCLAFTGSLLSQAREAAKILEGRSLGTSRFLGTDLYNLRFLKPVDEAWLRDLMNRYELFVCIEEGVKKGGFGEYVAELALRENCSCRLLVLGAPDSFIAQGKREELLSLTGLDGEGIAEAVLGEFEKPGESVLRKYAVRYIL